MPRGSAWAASAMASIALATAPAVPGGNRAADVQGDGAGEQAQVTEYHSHSQVHNGQHPVLPANELDAGDGAPRRAAAAALQRTQPVRGAAAPCLRLLAQGDDFKVVNLQGD